MAEATSGAHKARPELEPHALPQRSSEDSLEQLREQKKRESQLAGKYRGDVGVRIIVEAIWGVGARLGVITRG